MDRQTIINSHHLGTKRYMNSCSPIQLGTTTIHQILAQILQICDAKEQRERKIEKRSTKKKPTHPRGDAGSYRLAETKVADWNLRHGSNQLLGRCSESGRCCASRRRPLRIG